MLAGEGSNLIFRKVYKEYKVKGPFYIVSLYCALALIFGKSGRGSGYPRTVAKRLAREGENPRTLGKGEPKDPGNGKTQRPEKDPR